MPVYDYHCPSCNAFREIRHHMNESPKVLCIECGTVMVKAITTFPHTKLAWNDPRRWETGSDRMVIRAAKRGRSEPLDDGSATLQTNLGLHR